MGTTTPKPALNAARTGGFRIVASIASKDLLEAFKNHITLSILVGATMLTLSGLALPRLLAGRNDPVAVVYDPARSGLVQALELRQDLKAIAVDSQAELEQVVAESARPLLGLVLPPDFRLATESPNSVTVEGYFAHWVSPDRVAQQASFFEARLGEAAWRTVRITTLGHAVYPTVRAGGQIALYAMHLAVQLLIVGVGVVPYLLVEEKEAHTFDALLVSPASLGQVVTGKAVAGALLCLLGGAVVFACMARWVVHWDVALLAILLGATFAVGVGLLGGALLDNAQSAGLVLPAVLVVILLVPALFRTAVASGLPAWVQAALPYLPTLALMDLVRASLAGDLAGAPIVFNVIVLVASAAIVYALVIWRVRQAGR